VYTTILVGTMWNTQNKNVVVVFINKNGLLLFYINQISLSVKRMFLINFKKSNKFQIDLKTIGIKEEHESSMRGFIIWDFVVSLFS